MLRPGRLFLPWIIRPAVCVLLALVPRHVLLLVRVLQLRGVKDSVEEKILELQESKRAVMNAAFGSEGAVQGLSMQDILYLFD